MERKFNEYMISNNKEEVQEILCKYLLEYLNTNINEVNRFEVGLILGSMLKHVNYSNNKYANYTVAFQYDNDSDVIPDEVILTTLLNYLPSYFFKKQNQNIILKEHYIYRELISYNRASTHAINFMNYIAKKNNFARKFTMQDLYDKFNAQLYYKEMNELKKFIQTAYHYYDEIKKYKFNADELLEYAFMDQGHTLPYEVDVDANAYAYYKATEDNISIEPTEGDKKLLERIQVMKKR